MPHQREEVVDLWAQQQVQIRGPRKKKSVQVAKNVARVLPKLATAVEWLNSESNLGPNMPGAAIMLVVVDQSNRRSWKGG